MTTRVAVPSKGRLRESVLDLLRNAGYRLGALARTNAVVVDGVEFIEMRPSDAAAWLAAGRLDAGFISTDTALEAGIEDWSTTGLGFAKSDLVVACRKDSGIATAADLSAKTVATHLPKWTRRWFEGQGVDVNIVSMGGSLEGVCARGMADAIVDLRETGGSLARNSLHAIAVPHACEATLVHSDASNGDIESMVLRIEAAQAATQTQYLVLHIAADRVDALSELFHGLAAPTLLPLAGRQDLVAAHMVVNRDRLWAKLSDLRELGATGIVALPTDAIVN